MRSLLSTFVVCAGMTPLWASVSITSLTPSISSPQALGTPVTFTAKATDSSSGPLAFQFSVSFNGGPYTTVQDFRGYPLSGGAASDTFIWGSALTEGSYTIRLVVKDFVAGTRATSFLNYQLNARASGASLVLSTTNNPLVVLASAPSCPVGSSFAISFRAQGATTSSATSPIACDGVHSMNQYVAGLYAAHNYKMNYFVTTGSTKVFGPEAATIKTGVLPTSTITFPPVSVITPAGAGSDPSTKEILWSTYGSDEAGPMFLPIMTDLAGTVTWYFPLQDPLHDSFLTRVLPGGYVMMVQDGNVWNGQGNLGKGAFVTGQAPVIIDAAGNLVQSTDTQAMGEALAAAGYTGTMHCSAVPVPVSVGTRCLSFVEHEFLKLPDGNYLVQADQEAIFAPGTQGDTSMCTVLGASVPCNVDVVGSTLIVLNGTTLQPVWFWSPFDHDGPTEIPITRPAIYVGDTSPTTCIDGQVGCRPVWLPGTTGVAPVGNDWLHLNSSYYRASDGNLIVSLRHQDWVILVQYQNGAGNGDVLWRLGCSPGHQPPVDPVCGDFSFNNVYNDVYPWFSHQHDVELDANGNMTMYDNGNTRVYDLGNSQNSRGYVISVDEVNKVVTPVLIQDLGYQSNALGTAELLPGGDYFFQASDIIFQSGTPVIGSPTHGFEVQPTVGESGNFVLDIRTTTSYRAFPLPNFYDYFAPQ